MGCAVLADRIYPQLIGNDIGCGMCDLPVRKLKLEKALRRLRVLGKAAYGDHRWRLLSPNLFADTQGTVGGGNHFCEVQTVAYADDQAGVDKTCLYL